MNVVWVQLHSAFEANDGLVELPKFAVRNAEVVENLNVVRRCLNHAFKVWQRFLNSAAL